MKMINVSARSEREERQSDNSDIDVIEFESGDLRPPNERLAWPLVNPMGRRQGHNYTRSRSRSQSCACSDVERVTCCHWRSTVQSTNRISVNIKNSIREQRG